MMSGNLSAASSMTSLNAEGSPKCPTHRKGLKFFCCKHELLLCSVCAVKKHRACDDVLTITEACDDKKAEGRRILDVYNQRITLVENAIVERKAAKKLLDTNALEIQNEVHQMTQRLVDLVKHEERALIQNLHDMQIRESESLENDISGLEVTCNNVKSVHASLAQKLKFSDVDLIHAVTKEKQQAEDNKNIETMVKKRFREIDFKFVVSPHVTSFLKHFKSLGKVMMSEDSSNGQKTTSSLSSALSDQQSSPGSRRASDFSQNGQQTMALQHSPNHQNQDRVTDDDSHLSARERWTRDRQRQTQTRTQNSSPYGPLASPPTVNQSSSGRTLPRPATPDLYNRQRVMATKRDFTERPMSTPPMNVPLQVYNQRGIENTQSVTIRPHSTVPNTDRTSPVSPRSPTYRNNNGHEPNYETHHSYPVHVFQQRGSEKPRVRSPELTQHFASPAMAIKDEDSPYGRSFAAVQITNNNAYGKYANEERNHIRERATSSTGGNIDRRMDDDDRSDTSSVFSGQPPSYARTLSRRRGQDRGQHENGFDRARSPSEQHGAMATDEEKQRRWVHRTAFTSNGIGSKRLLCGIAVLPDGRLILVDQEHYTVQLYDQRQRFINEIKLDSRPYDVTVLGDNKIGVSLQTERTIKFFIVGSDTLTPVADLGVPCEMVCYGICRGNGCYCVCCGDEVWILSDEGRVVNQIKNDKAGNALFIQAEYITIDTSGNTMFVSDAGSNKVVAMTIDGRRLWEFTYQGFKPSGIQFVDRYLYICDRDQHRVLMLNSDGNVVKQSVIGRIENPRALAFHPVGNVVYVTQMRYDAIVSPSKPIQVFSLQ